MNGNINEVVLEDKLTQLEQARQWSPQVVSRLENMIRTADDYELFRINPIQYAANKGLDEQEAIDLFLYSANYNQQVVQGFLADYEVVQEQVILI